MQLPKLTPLQSRFAASLTASLILLLIYLSLSNRHLAYAAEIVLAGDGTAQHGEDHNWWRIEDEDLGDVDVPGRLEHLGGEGNEENRQESAAEIQSRAVLKREDIMSIPGNNAPGNLNILAGDTQFWLYSNATLWSSYAPATPGLPSDLAEEEDGDTFKRALRKRNNDVGIAELVEDTRLEPRQSNGSRTVYISINTCLQPLWNGTGTQTGPPPQLTMYISTSSSLQNPGPGASSDEQQVIPLDEGYANYSLSVSSNLYLSVSAPALSADFNGFWNYGLAVSIDDYYYGLNTGSPFLYLVDSDTSSALLVTDNLTQADANSTVYQQWMNLTTPFIIFAQNVDDLSISGVENSFCGLQTVGAQIMANEQDPKGVVNSVQMGMITRGLGNKPKEQFHIRSLNGSSSYHGILAMQGNSTANGPGVVGGGGQVWFPMNFTTKADGNCALLYNLEFCDEVAYAVPSNPNTFPYAPDLAALYDSYAAALYQNFSYSLQQIPCNTTSTAQYSLAKTCDECAAAYKQWLCAVSIPRCEDWTSQSIYLQPRNVGQLFYENHTFLPDAVLQQPYVPMSSAPGGTSSREKTYISSLASNSSRSAIIDSTIMPGPYKEVLPCKDLCYSLVQSCPASLGFSCPLPGRGLEVGYGDRSSNGTVTCSYLGAVYYFNHGGRLGSSSWAVGAGLVVSIFMAWAGL